MKRPLVAASAGFFVIGVLSAMTTPAQADPVGAGKFAELLSAEVARFDTPTKTRAVKFVGEIVLTESDGSTRTVTSKKVVNPDGSEWITVSDDANGSLRGRCITRSKCFVSVDGGATWKKGKAAGGVVPFSVTTLDGLPGSTRFDVMGNAFNLTEPDGSTFTATVGDKSLRTTGTTFNDDGSFGTAQRTVTFVKPVKVVKPVFR